MDIIIPQRHQAAPNTQAAQGNIRMHGEDANILVAAEYNAIQDAHDIQMAKMIAEALNSAYPGHLWAVNVRGEHGIATIHNMMLSGEWGYTLHLDKRYSASETVAAAKRGAGEILERYNVARGRANMDKMSEMKTDFAGRVLGDHSK